MSISFLEVLEQIRAIADSEVQKGRIFERLMRKFFAEDPWYKERFSNVWLWSEWAAQQRGFDAQDTGIDLVAEEREGGFCAVQCKCYAPDTRISIRSSPLQPATPSPPASSSIPAIHGGRPPKRLSLDSSPNAMCFT